MKLLHIDASILGANSVSRQLSAAAVARLKVANPGLEVTYRDLAANPLGHLSGGHLAGDPALEAQIAESATVLQEFLDADAVVIGAPMYNFTLPSQLKTWLDRILVAGKTFRYGPDGVEGLAKGKRLIIAISRGGLYGAGAPAAALEHLETYLRDVFNFIGIQPEFLVAEGVNLGPQQREESLAKALAAASELRAA